MASCGDVTPPVRTLTNTTRRERFPVSERGVARCATNHMRPGVDHVRPGVDHVRPGVDHVRPGVDHVRPGVDHVRPGVDHVRPGVGQRFCHNSGTMYVLCAKLEVNTYLYCDWVGHPKLLPDPPLGSIRRRVALREQPCAESNVISAGEKVAEIVEDFPTKTSSVETWRLPVVANWCSEKTLLSPGEAVWT